MFPPSKPRYVYLKRTPPRIPNANPATCTIKANPATCTLQANPATFIRSKPRHVTAPPKIPTGNNQEERHNESLHVPSKQTPLRLSKANPATLTQSKPSYVYPQSKPCYMYPPSKPRYVYPKQAPPCLSKANPATFTLKENPATCTLQANPATFIQSKPRHASGQWLCLRSWQHAGKPQLL